MATFTGTEGADIITPSVLSPGVTSTPIRTGTTTGDDVIYGRGGDDRIDAYIGNDHAEGGAGNDQIDGNQGDDYLAGDHGDDWLVGGEGDDYLNGGSGVDRMDGGYGDDSYLVADVGDAVGERDDEGSDAVESYLADYTLTDHVEHLYLSGNYAQNGSGNGLGNTILANDFANVLSGLGGADLLSGGAGRDTLRGGGDGDALFGGDGIDVLRGQGGADEMIGGDGADILIGGAGADRFHFEFLTDSAPGRRDVIRAGDGASAFQGAGAAIGDAIFLGGIDANALTPGVDDAFVFGGVGTGRLSLVNSGGHTIVRGNTDADADFELEIVIEDGAVLASAYSAADFYL